MKQGIKTVENLFEELLRQRKMRKDLIADTSCIRVNSDEGNSVVHVSTDSEVLTYGVSDIAHRQLADHLGIPFRYYERMRVEQQIGRAHV